MTTTAAAPDAERTLAEFSVPSEPGNERLVMEQVAAAVGEVGLPPAQVEKLKTAVSEAAMNAIEHGNSNQPELSVEVRVVLSDTALCIEVTDHGHGNGVPETTSPDLDEKLAGRQTPRGWGLFLIKNMVDEMHVSSDGQHHVMQLVLHLGDHEDGN